MQAPHVISFSRDPQLARGRAAVLATRFRVTAVQTLPDLQACSRDASVDVLVICHSISPQERAAASELARRRYPATALLLLTTRFTRGPFDAGAAVLEVGAPERLLTTVASLLSLQPTPAGGESAGQAYQSGGLVSRSS